MEELEQIKSFPITVYGDLERFNEVTSKARCRVFYKGVNRNGTYISDEFAEKLLASIPYTPVKGIYDGEDYTDHGYSRSLGRIYGIVPENPNVAWEKNVDEDGVEREYACVDVLIFTALYPEAMDVIGKSESMEIYDKSIQGEWKIIDGKKCFAFTEGCFLGLQILGDDVKPCFEGAAFFSLYESLATMVNKIEEYNKSLTYTKKGGEHVMSVLNYKLSDRQKFDALWSLLNTNYTEEGDWTVEYDICDIYDEYALVKNYCEQCYERVYYQKDDATDSLYICGKEKAYILDVTEAEYEALNAIRKTCGSYEKMQEVCNNSLTQAEQIENLTHEKEDFELKIEEYSNNISTLTTERDEIKSQYEVANDLLNETKTTLENVQASLSTLQSEHDTLVEYKKNIETAEKQAILTSYAEMLSEDILNAYAERFDEFTAKDLDKELAYEVKQTNPSVFTKTPEHVMIPKTAPTSSLEEALSKYVK